MKKILLAAFGLTSVFAAKAQNVHVQNIGCQTVIVYFIASQMPSCANPIVNNSAGYSVAPGTTLDLSMYPSGPFPAISWSGALAAGCEFSHIKFVDPSLNWGDALHDPCFGLPPVVGPEPGCGVTLQAGAWNPTDVDVQIL